MSVRTSIADSDEGLTMVTARRIKEIIGSQTDPEPFSGANAEIIPTVSRIVEPPPSAISIVSLAAL